MVVMRKGLLLLSLFGFVMGLGYVLTAQPPLLNAVVVLGVALVLCFLTAMKGV